MCTLVDGVLEFTTFYFMNRLSAYSPMMSSSVQLDSSFHDFLLTLCKTDRVKRERDRRENVFRSKAFSFWSVCFFHSVLKCERKILQT